MPVDLTDIVISGSGVLFERSPARGSSRHGLAASAGGVDRDVRRASLDPPKPRAYPLAMTKIESTLLRTMNVRVERDVRDREPISDEVRVSPEPRLQNV